LTLIVIERRRGLVDVGRGVEPNLGFPRLISILLSWRDTVRTLDEIDGRGLGTERSRVWNSSFERRDG